MHKEMVLAFDENSKDYLWTSLKSNLVSAIILLSGIFDLER